MGNRHRIRGLEGEVLLFAEVGINARLEFCHGTTSPVQMGATPSVPRVLPGSVFEDQVLSIDPRPSRTRLVLPLSISPAPKRGLLEKQLQGPE